MANETHHLDLLEQSAVRELANIGLGHATTAIATMTGKTFHMSVPDAESIPLEEIPFKLGGGERMAVGTHMPIEGDTGGRIAFLMHWESAQALWRMLIGSAPDTLDQVTEMEESVMLEVGNIINSSFLAAISDMTGLRMEATPPCMSIDMTASVLSTIVCEAACTDSAALAVRTSIQDEACQVDGFFLFIPTVGGLRKLFTALGLPEAA